MTASPDPSDEAPTGVFVRPLAAGGWRFGVDYAADGDIALPRLRRRDHRRIAGLPLVNHSP